MLGILDIYIERKTYRLSILVYHTNKIGFGEAIGKITDITDDIVNIGLHFFHKDVRLMLPLVVKHSIVAA